MLHFTNKKLRNEEINRLPGFYIQPQSFQVRQIRHVDLLVGIDAITVRKSIAESAVFKLVARTTVPGS